MKSDGDIAVRCPAVFWLTGLSGTGKTTLAIELDRLIRPIVPQVVRLDGDVVRAVFAEDLGFTETARVQQIGRMQRLAYMLAAQSIIVIVAALYAREDLLAWNRANLPNYCEIYLQASVDFLLCHRDGKALYSGAMAGNTADVVGVQIPWHAPRAPHLVIDAERQESPFILARRIMNLTGMASESKTVRASD